MSPVCWYRQHLFNCGHVFHRSYAAAVGRNEPVGVAVLGLKGRRTVIRWWWYISCLGCYCTHVAWHNGTLKDCLIGVELSTSMCHLQWHPVRFPHEHGGESYAYRAGSLENIRVSEGWRYVAGTEDCLVLNSLHWLRKGSTLRCLTFWRMGESQMYNKSIKWQCMCVYPLSEWYPLKL